MRWAVLVAPLLTAAVCAAEPPLDSHVEIPVDPVQALMREQAADTSLSLVQPTYPGMLPQRRAKYRIEDEGTVVDLGVATRNVAQLSSLTNDDALYQYVSADLRPVMLGSRRPGSPSVTGTFLLRVGVDTTAASNRPGAYDPFSNLLDVQRGSQPAAETVYTAYLEASDLVPGSRLRMGRQLVMHTGAFQLDGAHVAFRLGEHASAYAYGGVPVSYFVGNDAGNQLEGAGAVARPWPRTRLEAEYTHVRAQHVENDLVTVAAQQGFAHGVRLGVRFRQLDTQPWDVRLRLGLPIPLLGLLARVRLRQVLSDVHGGIAYPISPFTSVLGPERPLTNVSVEVTRPLLTQVDLTAGTQAQALASGKRYASQSYERVFAQVDLMELPWRGAFVTPIIEYWNVSKDATTQLGLRWTQRLSDRSETWIGTEYAQYLYDYLHDRQRNHARLYYTGVLWHPVDRFGIGLDLQAEQDPSATGGPFLTLTSWVTYAFP
jgi:hypothetical protein